VSSLIVYQEHFWDLPFEILTLVIKVMGMPAHKDSFICHVCLGTSRAFWRKGKYSDVVKKKVITVIT
jgi:hypothetical protein